ncbi:MAG TPA: tetratricopeptide repeat protein [Bacteroidia bacterium]|jgi:tetratricopeptide (TPR) repeat protein|nr:tetratricopeptide repeat protein [Bacteroidia bacterium]
MIQRSKKYLCAILLLTSACLHAQMDSLLKVIRETKSDSDKVKALTMCADLLAYDYPDTIFYFCNQALLIINEHQSKNKTEARRYASFKGNALNDLGFGSLYTKNNAQALNYYNQALTSCVASGDSVSTAGVLVNRGLLHRTEGDMPDALNDYLRAYKILEGSDDKSTEAVVLNNLGRVYDDLGDSVKTLEYLEKSIELYNKTSDAKGILNSITNLGIYYSNHGHYVSSVAAYRRAMDMADSLGMRAESANALGQMATSLFSMGKKEEAMLAYEKSVHVLDSLHSEFVLSTLLRNEGQAYFNLGQNDKALPLALRALELSKQQKNSYAIYQAAQLAYKLYKAKNDPANALNMFELYINVRDSTLNDQTRKTLVKKQFQFEYDKKEALASADREKEKLAQDEEIKRQALVTYFVSAGLFLLVLFTGFLFNRFRVTRRQKKLIEEKKKEVEEKQKEILDSINYAKRIQRTLLPHESAVHRNIERLKK